MDLQQMGKQIRAAFSLVSRATFEQRKSTVLEVASLIMHRKDEIIEANAKDVESGLTDGLTPALIDRLTLTDQRLSGMAADLKALANQDDVIGRTSDTRQLPNGLLIERQSVPLGVLGVIYESRPNVTIEVAALAIKTGNTVILRGGKETIHTNRALVSCVHEALMKHDLPIDAVGFIDDPDRKLVAEMLQMNTYIDVIIPRGGEGLHAFCRKNANIPVITGGIGICHLFVDMNVDMEKALEVIFNAKTQRPSVCNALDTVLVHEDIARDFLPMIVDHLSPAGVTFRAEPIAIESLAHESVFPAGEKDFDTEWLSLILGLKVVKNLEEAIAHIHTHSTFHSDGILTESKDNAEQFVDAIDSSVVYVNASTRFTDGSQMGLGAEVAVSTQRIHARGPMGLPELTSYKWVIRGNYTTRR